MAVSLYLYRCTKSGRPFLHIVKLIIEQNLRPQASKFKQKKKIKTTEQEFHSKTIIVQRAK